MSITISAVSAKWIIEALRQSAEKQSKEHKPDPAVQDGYKLQPHDFAEWGYADELENALNALQTRRVVKRTHVPIMHPSEWDEKALELARQLGWRLDKTRAEQRTSTMQVSLLEAIRWGSEFGFSNPMGRLVHSSGNVGIHWTNTEAVKRLPEGTNVYIKTGYQEPPAG